MIFLILGTFFLLHACAKLLEDGISGSYEFFLLGSIMFIPGSYHTFLAAMAWRGEPGYSFEDVAVFDDDFNKRNDD